MPPAMTVRHWRNPHHHGTIMNTTIAIAAGPNLRVAHVLGDRFLHKLEAHWCWGETVLLQQGLLNLKLEWRQSADEPHLAKSVGER